jgi:PEGA domain
MRGGGQVFAPGAGVPRGSAGVRGGTFNRGGAFNHGSFGTRGYGGGRWWGGRSWNVAPLHYYRPYYAFRPHFNLGFGLWSGYPLTWAYPYYYPSYPYYPNYPYYPYPYSYAPAGPGYSVAPPVDETPYTTPDATVGTAGVQPDQSDLGGISFQITPSDAQVFVDGNYVGTVGEFTPTTQPLGVPSGRHHLEIRDVGYKTMSFDVDIVAGQVIPYQGQMER